MNALLRLPRQIVVPLTLVLSIAACAKSRDQTPLLTADMPLHLEDHLAAAKVEGAELPETVPATVEWRFSDPQPDWKPTHSHRGFKAPHVERTKDALRVTLLEGGRLPKTANAPNGSLRGGIYIDFPDWHSGDWAHVVLRARTTSSVRNVIIGLNPLEGVVPATATQATFQRNGGSTPLVSDGSVQTYHVRLNWGRGAGGLWRRVGLDFSASEPGSIDILSVSVVPTAALYAQDRLGLRSTAVAGAYRRSVFIHAPGRLEYLVRVPSGARLQMALGVLRADVPVAFKVHARLTNGETTTVFQEAYADSGHWADRAIDLSSFAGKTITLALDTTASDKGTVALWGSPTLSGSRRSDQPNVIVYVIDGGGADYMSVYGYSRRTTPNLERLAAAGAVFERVYSNSQWTKPSTASFMTSLQNSVLGTTGRAPDPVPEQAVTMAEHFHRAGYQTAVFTSNPNAASVSGLERGVDVMRDTASLNTSTSSAALHQDFWQWRDAYQGLPYWVHFQPTDVHWPYNPDPAYAGLFISPDQDAKLREWGGRLRAAGGWGVFDDGFKRTGIDRHAFYQLLQGMYDQSMVHNDHQLGRLVDRLKATGEWSNTLLIVTADHSINNATDVDMAVGLLDPLPPRWALETPMFRPSISRVPLVVVWPEHITGGLRFDHVVSLLDLLPTVLDLVGLPKADLTQGQSLAPLLRGEKGWTARPVILDQFTRNPATHELEGRLEVVDARWGASMWIGPPKADPERRPPWPVLVYDLWYDPACAQPINEQRPDLVKKYTRFLEDTWKEHQALAKRFTSGGQTAMTSEQLERLRSLGYFR